MGMRDWFQPVPEPAEGQFFARERSGYGLLVAGVGVATAVEIVPVHLLLSHFWTPIAGWVATVLAIQGAFWIYGDWQAVRRIPSVLADDVLKIRVGRRWAVDVPYGVIESVRPVLATEVKVKDALQAFPSGRPTHCLDLREPVEAIGPYGIRKKVQRIALLVDDPRRFESELGKRLNLGDSEAEAQEDDERRG